MKCNNNHCIFNFKGYCCHEDEKAFLEAEPNKLDCKSSVRADIQQNLLNGLQELQNVIFKLNHREVNEVLKFIKTIKGVK